MTSQTVFLLVLLAVVLALVLWRVLRGPGPAARPDPDEDDSPAPDCPQCGLGMMNDRHPSGRLAYKCPACCVWYVARPDAASPPAFPGEFDEEEDWTEPTDPTTDGTVFGV